MLEILASEPVSAKSIFEINVNGWVRPDKHQCLSIAISIDQYSTLFYGIQMPRVSVVGHRIIQNPSHVRSRRLVPARIGV